MEEIEDIEKALEDLEIEKEFLKIRKNGLLLNDRQIEVLKRYQIDYLNYSNLSSLLFALNETIYEDINLEDPELDQVIQELEETHYYQETRK